MCVFVFVRSFVCEFFVFVRVSFYACVCKCCVVKIVRKISFLLTTGVKVNPNRSCTINKGNKFVP